MPQPLKANREANRKASREVSQENSRETSRGYDDIILEHANHPSHHGELKNPDYIGTSRNDSCGDEITIYMKVKDGCFTDASWVGDGCAISKAAADILCCTLLLENDDNVYLEKISEKMPGRIRCIETPFKALHDVPFSILAALAKVF